MLYDLHTHTTASDGKLTPAELIDLAVEKKLKGIAITDHDTIEGVDEAIKYSKNKKIKIIPGIEISCDTEGKSKEVHIVGLFIDYKNIKFKQLNLNAKENSKKTAIKILKELTKLGYELDLKKLEEKNHFGRPFIAELLMKKYPKDFPNRRFVFDEYLGSEGKIKIMPLAPSMKEGIDLIHKAGGIAILAHPGYLKEHDNYFIEKFIELGGEGIETENLYLSMENPKLLREKYRKIAKEKNLMISGGTDFHYKKEREDLGMIGLTEEQFEKLKNAVKENT